MANTADQRKIQPIKIVEENNSKRFSGIYKANSVKLVNTKVAVIDAH